MAAAVCLSMLLSAGCTMVRHTRAMRAERELAASGFQLKLARTPEQKSQIELLPQRKLVRVPFEGGTRYVYGDADFCQCIYAGTEGAFQRYRRAVAEDFQRQALADSMLLDPPIDAATAERNESLATRSILDPSADVSLDLESWGPWGPWY
jgi:hypothetical protein